MAKLDWSDPTAPTLKPGIYYVEVVDAVEKVSRKGEAYFSVALCALDWGREALCDDILMLQGKGRGIGVAKLRMLGVPDGQPELQAGELIGKRVYAAVDLEVREYEGKTYTRLKVDMNQGVRCGYWPETDPPPPASVSKPGYPMPSSPQSASSGPSIDDTPF